MVAGLSPGDKDARSQRPGDALGPACYNFMIELLLQNLCVTLQSAAVIDLSGGLGEAAKAALDEEALPWLLSHRTARRPIVQATRALGA